MMTGGKVRERYHRQVADALDEKRELSGIIATKVGECEALKAEQAAAQKSYEEQIGVLSEHLCRVDLQVSAKKAELQRLQETLVQCGHCGDWNELELFEQKGGHCRSCGGNRRRSRTNAP